MSSQSSESSSSSSSEEDNQEYETNSKRKYNQVSNNSDQANKKKQKQEIEEIIPGMKTLLGQQPDEIIERIFMFMPKSSITASGTCQQFRKVWKMTPFGFVYNTVIEMRKIFHKFSFTLDEKVELAEFSRKSISGIFIKDFKEREKKRNEEIRIKKEQDRIEKYRIQTLDFIKELEEKASQLENPENFKNAISKITRFDYDEERGFEYGYAMGSLKAYEIEFGELGRVSFCIWTETYTKHPHEVCFGIKSNGLASLDLDEEEWELIVDTAGDSVNTSLSVQYFKDMDIESIFDDHQIYVTDDELNDYQV